MRLELGSVRSMGWYPIRAIPVSHTLVHSGRHINFVWRWDQWWRLMFWCYREVKKWQDKIRARPAVDRGLNEPLGKWEAEAKIKGGDEAHAKATREFIFRWTMHRRRAKTDKRHSWQVIGFKRAWKRMLRSTNELVGCKTLCTLWFVLGTYAKRCDVYRSRTNGISKSSQKSTVLCEGTLCLLVVRIHAAALICAIINSVVLVWHSAGLWTLPSNHPFILENRYQGSIYGSEILMALRNTGSLFSDITVKLIVINSSTQSWIPCDPLTVCLATASIHNQDSTTPL